MAEQLVHPYDDELAELEQRFAGELTAELQRLARSLTRGVSTSSAASIMQRVEDRQSWQRVQDLLARWLQVSAELGSTTGREIVEQQLLGVKAADAISLNVWDIANEAAVRWAISRAALLTTYLQKNTAPRIQALVSAWIANSEPIGVLTDRIIGDYGYSASRAMMIAVTEVTRAFAAGNQESWSASGVVGKKRWRTNRDELVCPICAPLHRHEPIALTASWQLEGRGAIDNPPAHPRCRCWIVPVVD